MDRTDSRLTGRVLDGRYRVGRTIARGGMAMVYEATDLRLDRPVAVKVMHEGLADDQEFVRRFQREARSAARLSHPHAVAVFDTGDDDGTLFLVMELVDGRTLRDLIRSETPATPARALALVEPVLSALAAAHAAGIVHRDVKPENVLLAEDGRVKVADFGLSRAINAETQHTATGGVLIGTVSYLAPELVVDGTADARTDVYAAGVVLFELLTGSKPHQADNPIQVAYKHVHEDIPAPSSRTPGIPAYVDALVARATARDAALRPADAQVLLQQVRRVRLAVEDGVTEDAELTADLLPRSYAGRGSSPTEDLDASTTDELPEILEPAELVGIAELVGAGSAAGAVDDREHTRTSWEPLGGHAPGPARDEAGVYDQERDTVVATGPAAPLLPPRQRHPVDGGRPDLPPSRTTPTRSRRGPVALLLVLVLAVAAAAGGWWFGIARYTDAPAVLGLSRAAADARLDDAGLSLRIADRVYSETVPRGMVVSTDPEPGGRVRKEGTVGATLSLGPERHDVPGLRGSTLDAAQQQLLDAKLGYGDAVERYSDDVPEGQVIASDPVAGTALRRDAAVDLVVSRGPRPIKVVDWTGKDADTAEKSLTSKGFEVTRTEENDDTVAAGDVIRQSPDSGTLVKGDEVALVVSEGPVMVQVPDVVGAGVDAAQATLERAGFEVEVQRASLYIGVQYVVSTDPGAGSSAPRGSTIVISIV
ncbi:serine/threonine protein kinase [Nocardioides scoriae]|uniref:non-specific serine/threonine protein kinase n=1 Tax=Nocardioides scoriae TaxID=642780 RepID=A0A1H1L6P8_9ACTN|nr:Stk1 family PASTA domain-containing Ser/Thr kinase [Nocardioides scoriae]SDR69972.1 serine/threonine protein kinase [Nocardioides scoriae]